MPWHHAWLDWRGQLKAHVGALLLTATVVAAVVGGAVVLGARRRRSRSRPLAKARRLRDALSRMIEHPELVARPQPNVAKKALTAAASAAAATLARSATQRLVH